MSDLTRDIRILLSASVFHLLRYVVLVEICGRNPPSHKMELESGGIYLKSFK